jgi:hypothetical protein
VSFVGLVLAVLNLGILLPENFQFVSKFSCRSVLRKGDWGGVEYYRMLFQVLTAASMKMASSLLLHRVVWRSHRLDDGGSKHL